MVLAIRNLAQPGERDSGNRRENKTKIEYKEGEENS
jgi:hypothetical protein